jgi:hypothetical protein
MNYFKITCTSYCYSLNILFRFQLRLEGGSMMEKLRSSLHLHYHRQSEKPRQFQEMPVTGEG